MTSSTTRLAQARFWREWGAHIEKWAARAAHAIRARGGSPADADDARQAAYEAAWTTYLEWLALPEDERDPDLLGAAIGRAAKDAVADEWMRLRQRPRDAHQRAAGARATLLNDYLESLRGRIAAGYARDRLETASRALLGYHLVMEGLLHSSTGLVSAEMALLRDEVRHRLVYAIERLDDERQRAVIEGYYFEDRTLKEIGHAIGVRSPAALTRLHHAALDALRRDMEEFASLLAGMSVAGTLDDDTGSEGSVA